jgi:hypothetical protein
MGAPQPAVSTAVAEADDEAIGSGKARRWLMLVLPIWAALYGLLIAVNFNRLSQFGFHDPDDQLRLQQVRDLLAGQNWFDLHQYRIDAMGGGVLMHWSRLVDIPIAAVMLAARPLFGEHGAEVAALVVVPGLTLLAILALVGWIAARALPRSALPMVLIAVAFAVPVIVQVLPARIDHHGWQIALALAAVAGLLASGERRGGWITGGALAGWMAVSFEGLPMSAWIIAVLALAALVDPRMRPRLLATMQALALVSLALFAATRGASALANHCDAIAPVHLAAFGWGALAITAAHWLRPNSQLALLAGLGIAAVGAIAIVFGLAPQCTSGSFDMLDPVVRRIWYDNVQEGKPILAADWHLAAQYALPPLIGLVAACLLAARSRGELRRWWALYALVLVGALAIGLAVSRAAAISGVLAALPLGWLLSRGMEKLRRPPNPLLRLGELLAAAVVLSLVLLPVVPVLALEKLFDSEQGVAGPTPVAAKPCTARPALAAITALAPGGILAPLDMGPDILITTSRSVLATGHHRGAKAMRLTIDAFAGSPAEARAIMRAKNLRYVAICPSLNELGIYRKRAPRGFAAQIGAGNPPAWLAPVPLPATSGIQLWRRLD